MSSDILLNQDDLTVLSYIRRGHSIMAELFDMTRWDGSKLNRSIEKLDEHRYIERKGLRGANFWTFEITPKGYDVLPAPTEEEKRLEQYGISKYDVDLLRACIKHGKGRATEIVFQMTENEDDRLSYAGAVVKLVRLGYLKESGFLKRIIEVRSSGRDLLDKVS